jgi:hypothetical protein
MLAELELTERGQQPRCSVDDLGADPVPWQKRYARRDGDRDGFGRGLYAGRRAEMLRRT